MVSAQNAPDRFIDRLGDVSLFSHTPVKNIKAVNNQAYSTLNTSTNEIEVNLLMKSFKFEKTAMSKHFNEYYIESDLYPTASFSGVIKEFDCSLQTPQVRMIEGELTLKDRTMPLEIKVIITPTQDSYTLKGKTKIKVEDFDIDIPEIFNSYITSATEVSFDFEYLASKD